MRGRDRDRQRRLLAGAVDDDRRPDFSDRAPHGRVRHPAHRDEPRHRPRRARRRPDRGDRLFRPGSFEVLFLLDGATFVAYLFVLLSPFSSCPGAARRSHAAQAKGGPGYGPRISRGTDAFLGVIALNAIFIFAGFAGFDLLPVYSKNEAGVGEGAIGLIFFVNTIVIVLAPASDREASRRAQDGCGCSTLLGRDLGRRVGARAARRGDAASRAARQSFSSSSRWLSSPSASACTARCRHRSSPIWPSRASSAATWRSRRCPGRSGSCSDQRSAASLLPMHRTGCGSPQRSSCLANGAAALARLFESPPAQTRTADADGRAGTSLAPAPVIP